MIADRRDPNKPPHPGMVWSDKFKMWLDKDTRTPEQQAQDEAIAAEVEQGDLFDITRNFHGGADTSKEAHASVPKNVRAQQRQRVLSAVKPDGSTCDEIEVSLGMSHQAASARITELSANGSIVDTGKRRKTRSGRKP